MKRVKVLGLYLEDFLNGSLRQSQLPLSMERKCLLELRGEVPQSRVFIVISPISTPAQLCPLRLPPEVSMVGPRQGVPRLRGHYATPVGKAVEQVEHGGIRGQQ